MSFAKYYSAARGKLLGISTSEMVDLGEDWAVAGLAGAGIGAIASQAGSLDKKFGGMTIPLDGVAALATGLAGLSMHNKQLRIASIAMVGATSSRIFTRALAKGLGAHGDIEDAMSQIPFGFGHTPQMAGMSSNYGWGQEGHDALVEAAKNL